MKRFANKIDPNALIGVAAMTGGVPSGQAIESGSTATGNYVRWADGTQICWLNITVTDQACNTAYGMIFIGNRTWTFPKAFIAAPHVNVGAFAWSTGGSWGAVTSMTTTTAALRIYDAVSRASGSSTFLSVMAIGKWA